MAKNTRWSVEDMKKKKLVQNSSGVFVPVKSLVATGKVEKIEPIVPKDIPAYAKEFFDRPIQYDPSKTRAIVSLNARDDGTLWFDRYSLPEVSPEKAMEMFKEQGITIVMPSVTTDFWILPSGEHLSIKHRFSMEPLAAPRMTQSDKWKTDPNHIDSNKRQRKPVQRYFAFKDKLQGLCLENAYKLTGVLNILFIVPMSVSWSKKKREAMRFKEHQQRPDRDNYLKAFQDAFKCDDGFVWDGRTIKVWGDIGEIIIF